MRTFKDGKIILQNMHSGMFLQLFNERNEQTNIVEITTEDIENLIKELQEHIGTEPKEDGDEKTN